MTPEDAVELLEGYCWSEPDADNCVPVDLSDLNDAVEVLRQAHPLKQEVLTS